jgi:hypothetical protein
VNYPLAVTPLINARSLLLVLTELMYIGRGLDSFVIVETFRVPLNEGRSPPSRDCDHTRKIWGIG